MLGRKLVLDGVDKLLSTLTVGVNLNNKGQSQIVLSEPICTEDGDMELIFHGSFLPVPSYEVFNSSDGYVLIDSVTTEYPGKLVTYQASGRSRHETVNEEGELNEDEASKMQTNEPEETGLVKREVMIQLNEDKKECALVRVTNTGSRVVKVGSHFNFIEVNKMLEFDREAAFGMRLVRIRFFFVIVVYLYMNLNFY